MAVAAAAAAAVQRGGQFDWGAGVSVPLPPVMLLAVFWYVYDDARMCGADAGGEELSGGVQLA